MPLSRLENFLRNAEGNILYVNSSDFDATDSYENKGNSLARPFKTIQRALIEAARFSYQTGRNNDKIDRTTVLVYPGTHYIDNRPGFALKSNSASLYRRTSSGWTTSGASLAELGSSFNTDVFDPNNDLYKANSSYGGVIIPRGASVIGLDLRKTKIRPLYVPDPLDADIENSSIFNVTGTCYFTSFTFFDADPTRNTYKNYNNTAHVANFSHHKLTAFVYADGINQVKFGSDETNLTDLQMYYNKLSLIYGSASGRPLADYPTGIDFEPSVDEYRIVGNLNANAVGITSIRSGDGITATSTITVDTITEHGLYVDTPFIVSGVGIDTSVYNGSFAVKEVVGLTTFTYTALSSPVIALPDANTELIDAQIITEADSTSSASPYVFNCSLRSVYGLCGMFADGNKATGFKSMVVAQYTGISLQKDDNAYIEYDPVSKSFNNNDQSLHSPLHTYSYSSYKPEYENYHIKVSNGGFVQCVSIFAIGFARHFVSESGGDMSITNSNSNFGAISLEADGFRLDAFDRDNTGYITHIIPPKELTSNEGEVTWLSLDVKQTISVATTSRLYLFGYKNQDIAPPHQIDSYRIGAKHGDLLNLTVTNGSDLTTYDTPILMQSPDGTTFSSEKVSYVGRSAGVNSITDNTFTLTENHKFYNGEKIRVFSDNAEGPNNIELNKVYYAKTTTQANEIKISPTYNDAISSTLRVIGGINDLGGKLKIVSSVSDKQPGELAHPIQYDSSVSSWYINSSSSSVDNKVYSTIVGLGTTGLGLETGSTFIKRKLDNRSLSDRIYKLRYVIPKEVANARPPVAGFIIQETSTTGIDNLDVLTGPISSSSELRNPKIITNAAYLSNVITIETELPHNFNIGDSVKIQNIKSTNNTTGAGTSVYNGSFEVSSIVSSKIFTISGITINPGTFTNITNQRATNQQIADLPTVYRERYKNTFFIYRIDEIKKHISGSAISGQDGIYHLTIMSSDVSPTLANVGYGISINNFNQDVRNLYPQLDRDNYVSDPSGSSFYANASPLGVVNIDDKRHSVTKEAVDTFIKENVIGFGITGASVSGTAVTFYTDREHNLNSIKGLSLTSGGSGYGSTDLYSTSLVNSFIVGSNGSVKATLSGGSVSAVSVVDGGAAYGIGNTMTIAGGITLGIVQVTDVNDNIGDALQVVGFSSDGYNGVFKITGVPGPKSITVYNPNNVSIYETRTDGKVPFVSVVGKGSSISALAFNDIRTGIATITTTGTHGLLVGNKFSIVGTGHTIYDKAFTVKEVVGIKTFTFNVGVVTETKTYTSGGSVLKQGISANALAIGEGEINLGGRISYIYAGISTTLSVALDTSTTINLTSIGGFRKGDFIQINSEVLRIANDNCDTVIRGQFGTIAAAAEVGALVKKIRVIPIQFHRPSYLRASGHTFEYLGYGPGNYSTGMPQKQDRVLSADEIIVSQAREQDGGTVVYTGMNDLGEYYTGAKKLISVTGEEEVFDAPIFTYTGDDANTDSTKRLSGVFDDLVVRDRITVEGGENNNQTSQFYGPVNFTQKVTSTSASGVEAKNIFLKGTTAQPKLITVGISTPTTAEISGARSGDVSFLGTPQRGGYLGHIYADGDWRRFGLISYEKDLSSYRMDKLGIGQTTETFDGTNPLEINGIAKIKQIIVTDSVTFPANQTFSSLAFDGITIYNQATFPGTAPGGGVGSTTYTQRHLQGISQLYNLEVTGTYSTFNGSIYSSYSGISTFIGTLDVGGVTSTSGNISMGGNANISGITTTKYLNVTGITTATFGGITGAGFTGSTSGITTLRASAIASGILTLPATTDTLSAKETSDIFKNKTISTTYNTISGLTNANLSGTAGITNANLANSTISGISLGGTLATLTFGAYLTGTSYNGSTGVTIATNASSTGTSNIVARDASGDFTANRITSSIKANGLTEGVTISASALTGSNNIDLIANNVYLYTANTSGNFTFNFRANSSTSLNTFLSVGESITVAILTTQGSTAYYNTAVTIDGNAVTPKWYGEVTPTSGNVSGIDMYTYVIIKTGSAAFTVIASQSQYKQ